jgi:DNA (cytosine-5)-methyltransferase 1
MGRPSRFIDKDVDAFFQRDGIKVLDLCCSSGVSAEGIIRKYVHVLGIDINEPSYYPGTFLQADATTITVDFVRRFDFVWMSPPCQEFSVGTEYARSCGKKYNNILPQMKELAERAGVPTVIENVPGAGLRPDFMLCGSMFALPIMRHRHFQCYHWKPVYQKLYCNHKALAGITHTLAGSFTGTIHDAAESMGCRPTRLRSELKEGVPPLYSSFIFRTWLQNRFASEAESQFKHLASYLTSAQLVNMYPAH